MHRHDLDLIAAYADGSALDDEEARALVETCAECRAEYEAQRSVLSALGALPPMSPMTDIEKAGLHRDLWTELRNPQAAKAAASPGWMRWALAAASLFVVVGVAGVLGQLGQGDSAQEVAAPFADTTTASESVDRGLEEQPLAPQGEDGSATTGAGDQSSEYSATTLAAAEATVPAPVSDSDFEAVAADARQAVLSQSTTTTSVAQQADRCLDDERLGGQEVLATVELDRSYLIMVPAGVEITEETPITFVDASTCEVVHVVE